MAVPYELTGRVQQKSRTREALVAAVRELLARGVTPTVEGAATEASVSRTTAYRYFPNQRALLVATYPHMGYRSLLGSNPPREPDARLARVAEEHTRRILSHEREMRAVLHLSLEGVRPADLPMHRGLRIPWIEDALAPLRDRVSPQQLRMLVLGIGATLGIEAFVWLTDIARVSREEAVAIMRANALRLLRAEMSSAAR
jgi:AcrR family transcriptional regulator